MRFAALPLGLAACRQSHAMMSQLLNGRGPQLRLGGLFPITQMGAVSGYTTLHGVLHPAPACVHRFAALHMHAGIPHASRHVTLRQVDRTTYCTVDIHRTITHQVPSLTQDGNTTDIATAAAIHSRSSRHLLNTRLCPDRTEVRGLRQHASLKPTPHRRQRRHPPPPPSLPPQFNWPLQGYRDPAPRRLQNAHSNLSPATPSTHTSQPAPPALQQAGQYGHYA